MHAVTNFDILVDYRDKQKVTPDLIRGCINRTIWYLTEIFDVHNLTLSELFDIRRYVVKILRMNYELASDFNRKNAKAKIEVVNDHIMRAPGYEAANMFLNRYGLNVKDCPRFRTEKEKDAYVEYLKNRLFFARERAFDVLDSGDD